MLRQFGISTVVDLSVALIGVLIVLPAVLVFAEEHGPFTLKDVDPRPALPVLWRGLRSAPAAAGRGARGLRRGRKVPARFSLPALRRRRRRA
jgi:hypothetical protein